MLRIDYIQRQAVDFSASDTESFGLRFLLFTGREWFRLTICVGFDIIIAESVGVADLSVNFGSDAADSFFVFGTECIYFCCLVGAFVYAKWRS